MTASDALFAAIQAGDAGRVAELLDTQPGLLSARDSGGNSPLLTALYSRKPDVAATLLQRGCDVNLWEAAALGDVPRLQAILASQPAELNRHSHDGWTALHLAAHFGHLEAVRTLLARGADVHARSTNSLDNHPLHAALAGRSAEVARALLDAGANPNTIEHGGYTPLHQAAEQGDLVLVQLLLGRGASPTPKDDHGRTPLDPAEAKGHSEATGLLRRA